MWAFKAFAIQKMEISFTLDVVMVLFRSSASSITIIDLN
jgi:hypothetical protein